MKAAERTHHDVAAATAELPRNLERRFVGLCTRVAEEHLSTTTMQGIDFDRHLGSDRVGEKVADMEKRGRLIGDRLGDSGMGMTE